MPNFSRLIDQIFNQFFYRSQTHSGHDYDIVATSAPPPPSVVTPADISTLLRPYGVSKDVERRIGDLAAALMFSKNFEGKAPDNWAVNEPFDRLIREPIDWDCVIDYVASLTGHMDAAGICADLKGLVDKAHEHSWRAFPLYLEFADIDLAQPASWPARVVEQLARSHTWNTSSGR